jgi:hypothetical protein
VHLDSADQTLGILSPAQLRPGQKQCRRACSHSISKSVLDRMTGRKAGVMAPRKLSPAPTTPIFRHQRRPLLSERERNHRSRPPFYEAAAGRDLLLLALQPVCGQFSEFPKARFQCTRQRPMRPSTPVPSCREQTGRRPASSFEPCGHRSPSERRVEGCHWQPRNAAAVLGTHATPKARCSFPLSPSNARKS